MPADLKIPERYAPAFAEFLRLSPEELGQLLKTLRDAKPALVVSEVASSVADRLSLDRTKVQDLVRMLASLHIAREGLGQDVRDFVSALRAAAEKSGKTELQPQGDWSTYEDAIVEVLSEDSALAVAAKAAGVMADHANTYCHSRILTDLRPIFSSDISQGPSAVVTVHTLKIVYHNEGEHHEFFVAMDHIDLEQLAAAVDRAIKKENSLRSLTTGSGIPVLEVNS